MRIVRHPREAAASGCVASIGNFDGVHLGHRAVIAQLRERARALGVPAAVITFEPQPLEFFSPGSAPPRLTTFREKCVLLSEAGVERLWCLKFSRALARLEPDEFVDRMLVCALRARCVVVGDDFRFGRDRKGDYTDLAALAGARGFEVTRAATCMRDGLRVSSSRVREALAAGEMRAAAALLGRRFRMTGRVVPGDRRGRRLGYPTANVDLRGRVPPLRGVFAVRVHGLGADARGGAANLGTRPVFDGARTLLEVHVFDFDADLYGRRIEVEFVRRLRGEQRFDSIDGLREQIARDCEAARACLAGEPAEPV